MWLPTRRQVLGQATAAASLLAPGLRGAAAASPLPAKTGDTGMLDVIVVGAGLAGLTAARRLRDHGLSVRVLEARSQPGGRVRSATLETGTVIDVGAQFISDDQTYITALAEEAGVEKHASDMPGDTLFTGEDPARRVGGDALPMSFFAQILTGLSYWRFGSALGGIDGSQIGALDAMSGADFMASKTIGTQAQQYLAGLFSDGMCLPLTDVSAYELFEQARSVGGLAAYENAEQWTISRGSAGLVDYLAGHIGDALVLDTPVRAIAQYKDYVRVESARGEHVARRVVLAVPPQLLPSLAIAPALPAARQQALQGFREGRVIKTVVEFDRPWWREQGYSGTTVEPGGVFSAVVDGTPPDMRSGLLVAFSTSDGRDILAGVGNETARIAHFVGWLADVYGHDIPAPLGGRSFDWNEEPYSRGGYASRRGIGGWSGAPDLFAPLGHIHFAGTETADVWRSYMDGAVQSGERAAHAIAAELA